MKNKNLWESHDLHVQSDTLILTDIFENFRNICLEIYELVLAPLLTTLRLAWQAALLWSFTKVKLDLLGDINMLWVIEKAIRGGICHSIYRYAKVNNQYMKDLNKSEESSYVQYWYINNIYGWTMPQKLPINNFEWIEDTSQLNEDFIKNYNEESEEGYFLEVDVQYLEKLHELHNDSPFLSGRMKIKKGEKLEANLHDKTRCVIHIRSLKQALNHGLVF